jgi:EAL domain-containing protein (putative c-di-GMP-specific phosphodiesterase class I)
VHTIAEFVEDDKTLAALKEAGIDYAQGFGIDRPGPISKTLDQKA